MKIVKSRMLVLSIALSLFFSSSFAVNFFETIKKPCMHALQFWKKKKVEKPNRIKEGIVNLGILTFFALPLFSCFLMLFSRRFRGIAKIGKPKPFPIDFFDMYIHPIDYCTGWRTFNVDSEYEKLSRACRYVFNRKAKSILNNILDINAAFGERNHNRDGLAPIHIAIKRANLEIIRWLVEEKCADITALDNKGQDAFYYASYGHVGDWVHGLYSFDLLDKIRIYLSDAYDRYESLISKVADLKNNMDLYLLNKEKGGKEVEREDIAQVRLRLSCCEKMSRINYLMKNPKTPGYAKQLVMSDLVYISEKDSLVIPERYIIDFYKKIVFNYTFLNDKRFRKAAIFAGKKNIKDMNGKTVLEAYSQYGRDDTLLVQIVLNKVGKDVSQNKKIVKNYLSCVSHSHGIKGIRSKLFVISKLLLHSIKNVANNVKSIFNRKLWHDWHYARMYNAQKEGFDYLFAAKKAGNKKGFRDFANSQIVKGYVGRITENSEKKRERKVVDNIMEFAGADFGNKLYHKENKE